MLRSRPTALTLLALVWLFDSSPAHAKNGAEEAIAKLVVVRVIPNTPRVVTFDSQIYSVVKPLPKGIKVDIIPSADSALVTLMKGKPGGLVPVMLRGYNTVLWVQPTDSIDEAAKPVVVIDSQNLLIAELRAQLDDAVDRVHELLARNTTYEAKMELATSRIAELEDLVDAQPSNESGLLDQDLGLLNELSPKHSSVTLGNPKHCSEDILTICGIQWTPLAGRGVLRFVINTPRTLEITRVEAVPEHGEDDRAIGVHFDGNEATPSDHTSALVPAGARVHAAVLLRDPSTLGNKIRIILSGKTTTLASYLIDLRPQNGEGRITIRMQPLIGAVWFPNPEDKDELDAATLVGLGARVSYAYHTVVAVEAELAGIRTNDARFTEVLIDGMMGDISHNMNGARLLLGGALRVGKKYQPYMRLGVGAQVVDHDVRFVSGQDTTTGPGDGLSFDVLGWFGSGIDVQLGSHWVAGAGFSVMLQTGGSKAVEGGIQLGYGWGGYVRD